MANAMKQLSPEWFEARKGMITGSRVGAILGANPYNSRDDVMRDMVREYFGAPREFTGNAATDYGNANEWRAAIQLGELGYPVEETGFHVHPMYNFLGASPDGFTLGDMCVEIKCPYGKRFATSPDEFESYDSQRHYWHQMQMEMEVTGMKECMFFQWSEGAYKLENVKKSEGWLDAVMPELQAFHLEFIDIISDEEKSKPFLEDKEIDMSTNDEWKRLEQSYLFISSQLDLMKAQQDEIKSKLVELAAGRKCKSEHLTVFKTEKQGSVSYARALKELAPGADLEQYRGKPTTYWTVKSK